MKRIITLISLAIVLTMTVKAQEWRDELLSKNAGVIDSIVLLIDPEYERDNYESYMIYYKQPIQHDAPEEGSLPLRSLILVNTKKSDFYNQTVQMYIGGYELDEGLIASPNTWADEYSLFFNTGEISGMYKGIFIMPEHRLYGKSRTDDYATYLTFCNAKEAAADFHALAESIKKVFNGPWAITGVSKGGVAAAIQHAFYPDDADLFIPYVSPFPNGVEDLRIQDYWLTKPWTPELREHALHIMKEILNRPKVLETFVSFKGDKNLDVHDPKNLCPFLYTAICLLEEKNRQEKDRREIEQIFHDNQEMLKKEGLSDYTDAMLVYMLRGSVSKTYFIDEFFKEWEGFFFDDNNSSTTRAQELPSNLSSDNIYSYQSLTELGYFDISFEPYYETQAEADYVSSIWKQYRKHLVLHNTPEVYDSFEFDPSLLEFVKQQTANAKKPILFIYGEDDPWTGACIDDEYINGDNVRKYILPAQTHTACINLIQDSDNDLKEELLDFIDKALIPQSTAITNISADDANSDIYNLNGRRMNGVPERGIFLQKGKKVIK